MNREYAKQTITGSTFFPSNSLFYVFRTASSSWPEQICSCTMKGRYPGLLLRRSKISLPGLPVACRIQSSQNTVTSSYRIHTCFPFHRINRNLLSSDTLRFSMWSIFGNFYRYLFNRMSISFCVHTVNHYSVIVGKTHEKNTTDAMLSALTPFFII